MATATAASSLLLETVTTTPTELWNDSCAAAELEDAIAQGERRDLEPGPRARRAAARAGALGAADPRGRGRDADRERRGGRMADRRGDGRSRCEAARAGLRRHRGPTRTPVIQVDPLATATHRGDAGAGDALPPAGPEHPGEAPRHDGGTGRDRGGDGERHPDQRHREHDGRRRARGRRGRRARARAPFGGGLDVDAIHRSAR